jgi:hypothetical protein
MSNTQPGASDLCLGPGVGTIGVHLGVSRLRLSVSPRAEGRSPKRVLLDVRK